MVALIDPIIIDSYMDPMDVDLKDQADRAFKPAFKAAGVVPIENFLQVLDQKEHLQKELNNLTKQRTEDQARIAGLLALTEDLKQELDALRKRKSQSENDLRKNVRLVRLRANEKAVELQDEIDHLYQRMAQSKADRLRNKRIGRRATVARDFDCSSCSS